MCLQTNSFKEMLFRKQDADINIHFYRHSVFVRRKSWRFNKLKVYLRSKFELVG